MLHQVWQRVARGARVRSGEWSRARAAVWVGVTEDAEDGVGGWVNFVGNGTQRHCTFEMKHNAAHVDEAERCHPITAWKT